MFARYFVSAIALSLFAGLCLCQNTANKDQEELEKLKNQFIEEKKKAQQVVLTKFDSEITKVARNQKLSGTQRLNLQQKWTDEKEQFAKNEEIGEDSDLALLGLEYGVRVSQKYRPVSKRYDNLIKAALDRKELDTAKALQTGKKEFDEAQLPGRRAFKADTTWEGNRHDAKNNVKFKMKIEEMSGDSFKMRVNQNGGAGVYEIQGSIDGLIVKAVNSKQLEGKTRFLTFEGVVLGKTMVLGIGGLTSNGQAANGVAIVTKK